MNQETGIQITSQTPTEQEAAVAVVTTKLYPLDQSEFAIKINLKPNADVPVYVTHYLRRPTLSELLDRDKATITEIETLSKSESIINANTDAANVALYDKIAVAISGYPLPDGQPKEARRSVSGELVGKIPASHKLTALRGLYASECVVEESDALVYGLDCDTVVIKQMIGWHDEPDYVLRHTLQMPSEKQRLDYARKATQTRYVGTGKKQKLRIVTDLRAAVTLYDELFVRLDGAVVLYQSELPSAFLATLDPQFKQQVITALMSVFEESLSD